MNTTLQSISLALAVTAGAAFAFDPVGPPPKRNVAETFAFASSIKIPTIRLEKVSVEEALDFVQGTDVPVAFRVQIDAKALGDLSGKKVTLVEKDLTSLQAVAKIADQLSADVRVGAGKISLVPRR